MFSRVFGPNFSQAKVANSLKASKLHFRRKIFKAKISRREKSMRGAETCLNFDGFEILFP